MDVLTAKVPKYLYQYLCGAKFYIGNCSLQYEPMLFQTIK